MSPREGLDPGPWSTGARSILTWEPGWPEQPRTRLRTWQNPARSHQRKLGAASKAEPGCSTCGPGANV